MRVSAPGPSSSADLENSSKNSKEKFTYVFLEGRSGKWFRSKGNLLRVSRLLSGAAKVVKEVTILCLRPAKDNLVKIPEPGKGKVPSGAFFVGKCIRRREFARRVTGGEKAPPQAPSEKGAKFSSLRDMDAAPLGAPSIFVGSDWASQDFRSFPDLLREPQFVLATGKHTFTLLLSPLTHPSENTLLQRTIPSGIIFLRPGRTHFRRWFPRREFSGQVAKRRCKGSRQN